ncbi:hypothetical protein OROMI_022503 [Orobanche minor]
MVFVVFLLALILSTNPVESTDCLSVGANILQCRNYLQNPESVIMQPGDQCCHAANNIVDAGNNNNNVNGGDDNTDSLCECLRQNPLVSGFLPSKAQQLPILCNLPGFSPLVNCLVPSLETSVTKNIIPFPPLTPGLFPPLIPFPPLTPFLPPLIPFPPLTPILPPATPAAPPTVA